MDSIYKKKKFYILAITVAALIVFRMILPSILLHQANKEHFKGIKHFGLEILAALENLILRDSENKTVTTYLDFTYNGTLNVDTAQGISKAIENGFSKTLPPGLENKYHLDK